MNENFKKKLKYSSRHANDSGLTTDSLTSELNVRTPPSRLIDGALEQRNDLDTMLDSAKEEQLELLAQVEAEDDTDEDIAQKEDSEDGITEIDDRNTEL